MTSTLPPRPNLNHTLIAQLSAGPAFREVAAVLLRQQLQERYPTLDIDPETTMVGTPVWEIVEDQVVAGAPHYQPLTEVLAKQAVLAVPTIYLEGEHFLTRQPIAKPAVHLPVRIDEIAGIINVLAPAMIRGYQDQQVAYWNASNGSSDPHWQQLSRTLREFWNVDQVRGWTEQDCLMARQLFRAPDLKTLRADDAYATRAYLIDVEEIDAQGKARHLNEHLVTVLIGRQQGHEVILTHSLLQGYDKYSSLDQLGHALPTLVDTSIAHGNLQWRLVEPEGNYFDYLACALIAVQIQAIGEIDFSDLRGSETQQAVLAVPPTASMAGKHADWQWYEQALPDWLSQASTSDLNACSRHLKDLAAVHRLNEGKTYLDEIEPIQAYALSQLKAQMLKDHPDASQLMPEKIELVIKSLVIWGTFVVPGQIDTTTFNLVDLALANLIAVPFGDKTLRSANDRDLPAWLTVSYVESLVSRINIGARYPALIQSKLLQDPRESARRQTLYTQHLQVQLPLLALQYKIRRQYGINELGYRYVAALMQADAADRLVDGQRIVIRPLAFVPQRRTDATRDEVANMYVIGPQEPDAGPCLLYRPLLDPPLVQYPSPTNVLYAIQQSSRLRESVLAWLPDDVREDYARYVFPSALPSPWAAADFLVDPTKLWTLSGPMSLSNQVLNDELFATLFKANANALVTLADRQSVSNAESRWETFKRAGWLIFNATLPFLGRTVGAAAWVWQIMDQLQDVVDAESHPERQSPWVALSDLLLNLGMAIALHGVARTAPRPRAPEASKPPPPAHRPSAPKPLEIKKLPDIRADELPTTRAQPVNTSGAIRRGPTELGTLLDSFKVTKPERLEGPVSAPGDYQHLYTSAGKFYVPVGTRWFEVELDENDTVQIIDPTNPERTGPPLIHNRQGQWFIDLRLRLRGGGPKIAIRKAKTLAQKRAEELRKELSDFEGDKKNAQSALQQAQAAMAAGPSTSVEARRETYLRTLQSQRDDYETALQKLKELNVHAPTPDYSQKALNYIKAQTEFASADIREALPQFTPKLRTVLDQIERQASMPLERNIKDARELSILNQQMIQRLDYMQGRFQELRKLQRDGMRLITTIKATLPAYSSEDLTALQVTLSRNLCLEEASQASAPEAWKDIDSIVDNADIAIQCLRDTLSELSESRLDERIDTLSSLIEQFRLLDERLGDLHTQYPQHVITEPFQHLRRILGDFNNRAISNLALLSAERDTFRSRPSPPPTPPRPQKKFIRTRYNGQLIGEPRLTPLGLETGLVDIHSPLTRNVVATYHEKTPGVWVERIKTPPRTPSPVEPVDLQTSLLAGQALLDKLPGFVQHAATLADQTERNPIGIEYLFHRQARRLEQAIGAIETALIQSNTSEGEKLPASWVKKALTVAVEDLYRRSNEHVLKMIKQHPPTIPNLEWLKLHNAITIKKTISRRRLKSPTPDFLDEYTITDRSNHQALWYAHFHYSTNWTPARTYLSARLKTVEEHRLGAAADTTKGLSDSQKIAFFRSEISLEQARRLFFE